MNSEAIAEQRGDLITQPVKNFQVQSFSPHGNSGILHGELFGNCWTNTPPRTIITTVSAMDTTRWQSTIRAALLESLARLDITIKSVRSKP